jgi:transcription antitermination factor NusG
MVTNDRSYWVAVQVKTGHESMVAQYFNFNGTEHFLPYSRAVHQWSDRKKMIQKPLFPGYLFCLYNDIRRAGIVKTPSVIRVIGFGMTPEAVDSRELEAIRRVATSELECRATDLLSEGDPVTIHSGPLKGLQGLVVEVRGPKCRFVVSVTILSRSVAVEVDSSSIYPVQNRQRNAVRPALSAAAAM